MKNTQITTILSIALLASPAFAAKVSFPKDREAEVKLPAAPVSAGKLPAGPIVADPAKRATDPEAELKRPKANEIRFCTGSKEGMYYRIAELYKSELGSGTPIVPIETQGSVENLRAVSKHSGAACDAAMVQGDVLNEFLKDNLIDRSSIIVAEAHSTEYLHLICNENMKIHALGDLLQLAPAINAAGKVPLLIGSAGSGSYVTWHTLVRTAPELKEILDTTRPGRLERAAIGGKAAYNIINSGQAACYLRVMGLGSKELKQLDATNKEGARVVMGDIFTKKLLEVMDTFSGTEGKSKSLYEKQKLPYEVYPNLLAHNHHYYRWNDDLATTSVKSYLVINSGFAWENQELAKKFRSVTPYVVKTLDTIDREARK